MITIDELLEQYLANRDYDGNPEKMRQALSALRGLNKLRALGQSVGGAALNWESVAQEIEQLQRALRSCRRTSLTAVRARYS